MEQWADGGRLGFGVGGAIGIAGGVVDGSFGDLGGLFFFGLPGGALVCGEPFVERYGEGEELLFAVEGMDHFDVEFGVFEGRVVEGFDVVEEVSGEGAVGLDGGAVEAEVVVVLGNFLVDGGVVDGEGDEGDLGALGAFEGEEAAVEFVEVGGGDAVVIGGDELHACVFEGEGGIAVVGDDDADGDETMLDVGEAEEVAELGVVAGLGGDGDVLFFVGIEGGVLGGGLWRWRFFL